MIDHRIVERPTFFRECSIIVLKMSLTPRTQKNQIACGDESRIEIKSPTQVQHSGLHPVSTSQLTPPLLIAIRGPLLRNYDSCELDLRPNGLIHDLVRVASRVDPQEVNRRWAREGSAARIEDRTRTVPELCGHKPSKGLKTRHPAPLVFVFPTSALAAMKSMIMPATSLPVAASMPSMPGEELTSMITGP